MAEIQLLPGQIVPDNESDTACNNQEGYSSYNHPVPLIITKRTILAGVSHQVKAGITKGRNRMKYSIPGTVDQTVLRNKPAGQYNSACPLKNSCADDDFLGQLHHAANLQGVDAFLHKPPLFESDFPSQNNRQENADADKSQSPQLNQHQQHHLAEQAPLGPGICHHQPRHAGSAGCRKQAVEEWLALPVPAGYGKHQKQASCHDNQEKPIGNELGL